MIKTRILLIFLFSLFIYNSAMSVTSTNVPKQKCQNIFLEKLKSTQTTLIKPKPEYLYDEQVIEETASAKKALKNNFLTKKKFLETVRATLKEEFIEYDDFIDDLVGFAEKRLLLTNEKETETTPAKVVILAGPAGIGKTSVLMRYSQLLGALDRMAYVSLNKDEVEFPATALERLADQRHAHKGPNIALMIVDEVGNLKTIKNLNSKKEVPISDDNIGTIDGTPRVRIENEVELRQKSLNVLTAALGNGVYARTPQNSPQFYADQIGEINARYTRFQMIIAEQENRIKLAQDEKFNKDASTEMIGLANELIGDAQKKLLTVERDVYELLKNTLHDQPDFFTVDALKAATRLKIPKNLPALSISELRSVWKNNPENFALFLQRRAEQIPVSPKETFHNVIIAIVGNPEQAIEKVHNQFRGQKPSPDDLINAYKNLVTEQDLEEWLYERFGRDPAIMSRLRAQSVRLLMPLSQLGYDHLTRRLIHIQEVEYANSLESMGVNGTHIEFDESVYELIHNEAIQALMGPREYFPRVSTIIEPITKHLIATIAEQSVTSTVPSHIVISFNSNLRKLEIKANNDSLNLISKKYYIPKFREPPIEPEISNIELQMKATFLASTAVVGMIVYRSVPREMNLQVAPPTLFQFWDPPTLDTHLTKQNIISTLLAGMVGEQKFVPGVFISEWTKSSQELAISILDSIISDLDYRRDDLPNLIKAVSESNPNKQLPHDFIKAIQNNNDRSDPIILYTLTRMVNNILSYNVPLVKKIAHHIYANGRITPNEMTQLLNDYTRETGQIKRWSSNILRVLGPSSREILLNSDVLISGIQPGQSHVANSALFADNPKLIERLRKLIYPDESGFWR